MDKEKQWTKEEVFAKDKEGHPIHNLGFDNGRFTGFNMGGGWRSGPWECTKGHWVPNSEPGCPTCMRDKDRREGE